MTKLNELVEKYTAKGADIIPGVVFSAIDKEGMFCKVEIILSLPD